MRATNAVILMSVERAAFSKQRNLSVWSCIH